MAPSREDLAAEVLRLTAMTNGTTHARRPHPDDIGVDKYLLADAARQVWAVKCMAEGLAWNGRDPEIAETGLFLLVDLLAKAAGSVQDLVVLVVVDDQ